MSDILRSPDPEQWDRIVTIFLSARELDTGSRAAYLDGICAGNEELRAGVEQLLQEDERTGNLLDQPIFAGKVSPSGDPLVGKTLGHYQILEKLGEGGMGSVYKALDTRLQRYDAIKLLSPLFRANPDAEQRFLREARAASALDHPNICTIYGIERTSQGQTYIVMAYYPGDTIHSRIFEGPLEVAEALDIAIQASRGLAKAHTTGIVHRDIKPPNLIMTPEGVVKILDFGIAKLENGPDLTGEGMTLGTLKYMSPEQAQAKRIDHRTDIWSLGVVLYEMLAGHPPFAGETIVGIVRAIVNSDPQPLDQQRSDVSMELERVLQSMMAKDPAERLPTMHEVTVRLEAVRNSSTAATPRRAPDSPATPSLVVLPFANLSSDPENVYFSDGLTEELINALSRIEGLHVVSRTTAFHYRGETSDIREFGRKLGVAVVLEGSVRTSGKRVRITSQLVKVADGYQLWSERYDAELDDVFAVQDKIVRQIASTLQERMEKRSSATLVRKETDSPTAHKHYLKGRHYYNRVSSGGVMRGGECFRQAIEEDPSYARAHAGLAAAYLFQGFWGFHEPRDAWSKARASALKAIGIEANIAEAHSALGATLAVRDWNWQGAKREFEEAMRLDPHEPFVRGGYTSFYLLPHGMVREAVRQYETCLDLDPLAAQHHAGLAMVLMIMERHDEAIRHAREAIELSPAFLTSYWALGLTYLASEDRERAREALQQAQRIYDKSTFTVAALGVVEAAAGRPQEARRAIEELETLAQEVFVAPSHLAWLWIALDDHDRAFRWLDIAADERETMPLYLQTLPLYAPIRSDDRYEALLRKLRLSELATATAPVVGS